MNFNDPPAYEDVPLIRPAQRLLGHPTRFIAVFCLGSILLAVSVSLIVVFGRCRNLSTTTTTTTPRSVCFDGDSVVSKADGSLVRMNELHVGDHVLVTHYDGGNGMKLRSSPVLAIDIYQYYDHRSPLHYREILTASNSTALHITPSHSLLVRKKYQSSPEYLFASHVNVGDHLYLARADNRSIDEAIITEINDIIRFDAYAPLTLEGNLIVNHLIVSCYGTFTHSTGHLIKMVRRWWLSWHLNLMLISR